MKINKDEQETVIIFEAETGKWDIYTCVPLHINLFMKNARIATADIKVLTSYEGKPTSISFSMDNTAISIASLFKNKRSEKEPTEKQLQARRKFAEMAKARSTDK